MIVSSYLPAFFARLSSSSIGSFASGERTNGSAPVTAQNSRGGPLGIGLAGRPGVEDLAPECLDDSEGFLLVLARLRHALEQARIDLVLVIVPVELLLGRHLPVQGIADEVFDPDQLGVGAGPVVEDALAHVVVHRLAVVVGDLGVLGQVLQEMDPGERQRAVED